MINKDSNHKYCRAFGAPRKRNDIYKNLGNPYDIKGKSVIFIGKKEHPYCLTKNKEYTIIKCIAGHYNFCKDLRKRFHDIVGENKRNKRFNENQGEEYFILIINDAGHKRQYSHSMFKIIE